MSQALEFVKCPCCCGHAVIGSETADALALIIDTAPLHGLPEHVIAELNNIRNSIFNFEQHDDVDPLLT